MEYHRYELLYSIGIFGYNRTKKKLKGEYMNIFKQFADSLYSAKKMATYRKQSLFLTFVFLILLNLVASIPTFLQTKSFLNEAVSTTIPTIIQNLPDFEIKDGKYISEKKEEMVIPTDQVTLKFSPERNTATKVLDKNIFEIEFLAEKLAIKINTQKTEAEYDMIFDVNLKSSDFLTFSEILTKNINAVFSIYISLFFGSNLLFMVIQIFLISFFGYILMKQEKRTATYKEIWLVCTCAMVIPTVFFAVMGLLKLAIPFASFIFWGSAIFILYQIIKELPPQEN